MPRFLNRAKSCLISTSYKVMYSSLVHHDGLERLTDRGVARQLVVDKLCRRRRHHVVLARHPHDRLVSFFADKFRQDIDNPDKRVWQFCQRLFFPALGVSERDEFDVIADAFRRATFADFIRALPTVYRRDGHLVPQASQWRLRLLPGMTWPARVDEVIRIEEMDPDDMARRFGIDVGVRRNKTRRSGDDEYFTPDLRTIAARLYADDFERFEYGDGRSCRSRLK